MGVLGVMVSPVKCSREEISSAVQQIASYSDDLYGACLPYFEGLDFDSTPEMLENLHEIELAVNRSGFRESLKEEVSKIRGLISEHIVQNLPPEVLFMIHSQLDVRELGQISTVSKAWEAASDTKIRMINAKKLRFRDIFKTQTAKEVVAWLVKNPSKTKLEHADFSNFKDFDNECLEILTKNCPNIKHLNLAKTNINGDALKALENVKGLQSLNIWFCKQLAPDSLKYLEFVPKLKRLVISSCTQLEANSLQNLKYVKELGTLYMSLCTQLAPNSLKCLEFVKELNTLNIALCTQLESDALKHLVHVRELQNLYIVKCEQLDADSLKHLEFVKKLKCLLISQCGQLGRDSLQYLKFVKMLQYLHMGGCRQFDRTKIPSSIRVA